MPHTHGRYMQDLGFADGLLFAGPMDMAAIASAGTITLTRNAVGDIAWQVNSSSTATFSLNITDMMIRRSGFMEDTQNAFGSTFGGGLGGPIAGPSGSPGTGVPGSAEPQGRPGNASLQDGFILPGAPQPASGMGTLQQITPRGALKIKGFKPLSITVIYKVVTGAATALTCVLTQSVFANNVAIAKTTLLASAANGLVNVAQTNPYVTVIPIPLAQFYQITPLTELWFEIACQEPASNTMQLYGIEIACEFNYN
jgi:hypothetical protein